MKVLIVGAGGHGQVVAGILLACQQREADILEVFHYILPDYRTAEADGRQPASNLAVGLSFLGHKAD